jgi:hypothetical protein
MWREDYGWNYMKNMNTMVYLLLRLNLIKILIKVLHLDQEQTKMNI